MTYWSVSSQSLVDTQFLREKVILVTTRQSWRRSWVRRWSVLTWRCLAYTSIRHFFHWKTWDSKRSLRRCQIWPRCARVRAAVIAVCAPTGTDLEELHRGIADAAAVTRCPIVGWGPRQCPRRLGGGNGLWRMSGQGRRASKWGARGRHDSRHWSLGSLRGGTATSTRRRLARGRVSRCASTALAATRRRCRRSKRTRARDDGSKRRAGS